MRRFRDWPWSVKLAAVVVTLALLPMVIVTVFSEVTARRDFLRDSGSRNLQQATHTASFIAQYLDDVVGNVQVLARSPAAVEVLGGSQDMRVRLDWLMRGIKETKHLELLQIVAHNGTIIAATDPSKVGLSRVTAPFFMSAMAGQSRVHEPRYMADDQAIHIHASVPVIGADDRVLGVAAARVPLDEIDRIVAADTNYGGVSEYGMLWNDNGIIISAPAHPERRFHPIAPLVPFTARQLTAEAWFGPDTGKLLSAPLAGEALLTRSRWRLYDPTASPHVAVDLDDGRLQVTSVPVPQTRWTYAIATPESRALAVVRAQSRRNLAVAIATAIAAIFISLLATRWVSRPLGRVGEAARALADGDMSRRAGLKRRDEIGQLADTFDAMADSLAAKDAELRGYADSLERRVDERTADVTGLLRAVPDLIFKVSADGRLVDYVPAKGDDFGLPPEQFLGRPITDVLPHEVSPDTVERIQRALAGEEIAPYEYRLLVAGEERHYEARISPSSQGAVVVLVRDITERRRGEERTRFLASAAASLSASLDYGSTVETLAAVAVPFLAELCIVDLLEHGHVRTAAIAAAAPEKRAIAQRARERYPVRLESNHPVARALGGGASIYAHTSFATLREISESDEHAEFGTALGVRSLMVVPLTARGQTLGAMSFISLDRGRRYTQADLALASELADRAGIAIDNARLYRQLQESNRLKDEFLGTVSHELRTPLNAVLGWAQILKRTGIGDPDQAARAIDAIERNAQAQAQLVEDLLDTSRVVSGKLRITFVPVHLADIVQSAVESLRPLAKSRGLDLTLTVGEGLVPIMADAARLQQVIGNLVSNALKFTPPGGRVEVSVRRSGGTMEIAVADTGAGIAPEFLPFVFDRFRQADSTTTRMHGGLGLGLSIARHLVALHGGTIRAESPGEQQGATFTVVLPINPADQPAEPAAPASQETPDLAGVHVLVVDDQADARALLQTMLEAAGARVDTAASADEARLLIATRRPHLVVSDIGMPREDGYSLIRSIRQADEAAGRERLPSIAVTAYASQDDRLRALGSGYDRHVTKPVDPAALLQAIVTLIPPR